MSFNEQIQDILRRIVELEKVHTRYTGPPGRAATVRVGSVSTVPAGTPASGVNVGTPNAAVLNFAIPQGEDSTELNTLREERNDFREEKNSFSNELHEFRASVHEFGAALRAELHELHAHYADELAKVYANEVDAFCKIRGKACALIGKDGQ